MSDLVSRLLAAIEETERIAQEACDGPWHVNDAGYAEAIYSADGTCVVGGGRWGGEASVFDSTADALHVAHNDPAAVLRRCAADRKLIGIHVRLGDLNDPSDLTYPEAADTCFTCGPGDHYSATENPEWYPFPCSTLRALGEGYGISVEEETTGE